LEPAVGLEVAAKVVVDLGHEGEEGTVGGQGVEAAMVDHPQQTDGVVPGGFPGVGLDPSEQILGAVVPRPPQVHGQGVER